MYVDAKVTIWNRIVLHEEESVTSDVIINALKNNGPAGLWDLDGVDIESEYLLETEYYLSPEQNDGDATIELYEDDNDELKWDNSSRK